MIAMELKFEPANENDINCIYNFNKELIDKYENIQNIDYGKVLQWIYKKIKIHISEYTCVIYDNRKVGYYRFHQAGDKMEIDDLYIFPEFQNRGIGTAVLKKCFSDTDFPIFLYVFSKNIRAVSLYSKLGFEVIENIGDSRYIMQKN